MNNSHSHFLPLSFCQKLQSQKVTREKLRKALSYKKFAHKMLLKLTPGFSSWIPTKPMAVGTGGYGSNNANNHLRWVMEKKLEIRNSGLLGLGSTW